MVNILKYIQYVRNYTQRSLHTVIGTMYLEWALEHMVFTESKKYITLWQYAKYQFVIQLFKIMIKMSRTVHKELF